eukprot:COSAG02_NODE_737_length_17855_cov_18.729049_15_plen_82_part_00
MLISLIMNGRHDLELDHSCHNLILILMILSMKAGAPTARLLQKCYDRDFTESPTQRETSDCICSRFVSHPFSISLPVSVGA